MGSIKFSAHPLFYVFGLYYAFTGKILVFVIYTICALLHELGHSFVASNAGYRLNNITLMPFGAVAKGDIEGLKLVDEIKIALAGPLCSLAIGLFFLSLWWVFPEVYAFTDIAAEANFSMAMVNFLPIFPLDGGRVLSAYTTLKFGSKVSNIITKIMGAVLSILLFIGFIITLFYTINLSLLFFSMFVLFGTFGKARENKYVKLFSAVSQNRLKRGMVVKTQAVDSAISIRRLLALLDENFFNEIKVYQNGKYLATLSQERINKIIENADVYSSLERYV